MNAVVHVIDAERKLEQRFLAREPELGTPGGHVVHLRTVPSAPDELR
jgi:hypothetical protein